MKPFKPKRTLPEAKIRAEIIRKLELEGWFVKITHGGMFQSGFPDLFATHAAYGVRWIEVKNPAAYRFTPAQKKEFPLFVAHGAGVWVMTGPQDYDKLFKPCNWEDYL